MAVAPAQTPQAPELAQPVLGGGTSGGDRWLGSGELRELKVGPNAGCSSLHMPNRTRHRGAAGRQTAFGSWCDTTGHGMWRAGRHVWTVPLRQLLRWIGRDVDFVKIDAQGMDLEVFKSGGDLLRNVKRVVLEVIADDCRPVYEHQPQCSEVVATLHALGFVPLTPLPCTPAMSRGGRANHRCELEFVFVNARRGVTATDGAPDEREIYFESHQGHFNWCAGTYPVTQTHGGVQCLMDNCDGLGTPTGGSSSLIGRTSTSLFSPATLPTPPALLSNPPENVVLAAWAGNNEVPTYYSSRWPGVRKKHSYGRMYLCPRTCATQAGEANGTHMLGLPWRELIAQKLNCPFW